MRIFFFPKKKYPFYLLISCLRFSLPEHKEFENFSFVQIEKFDLHEAETFFGRFEVRKFQKKVTNHRGVKREEKRRGQKVKNCDCKIRRKF